MSTAQATTTPAQTLRERTSYAVLVMISFCHFLNDMIQSLLPAIYPILKGNFHLDFAQVGMITFTNQLTASVLQPVVGSYTDKRPQPFSLSIGMGCTLIGLIVLSLASSFPIILAAAAMIGIGSSVFHPESSRVARMASGGQHGFAQSIFQKAQGPKPWASLTGIPASEYPTPAMRPANSVLSNRKLQAAFGVELPSWQEALDAALHALKIQQL